MHILSSFEYRHVSAGSFTSPQILVIGLSFLAGSMGGLLLAIPIQPVFPVIGVPIGAIALGGLCAQFSPFVGTLGCGIAGGALGYQYGEVAGLMAFTYGGGAIMTLSAVYQFKK